MEITLDRIKKEFPICNNCLIENINKVITNRIKNIIKDNFNYPEYYLRDIELTDSNENNYLKLSNPEFKYLFGESSTIKSQLIYLMINSCLLCGNVYESKDEFMKYYEEHKEEIQEMQDTYKTQMEKIVDGVAVKVDAILEIIKGDNNVSRTKQK